MASMSVLPFASPRTWPRGTAFDDDAGLTLIPLALGRESAAIEGGVVRGERKLYAIVARSGQTLSVALDSVESNASLEIYTPEARVTRGAAAHECHGPTLTRDDQTDTRSWRGRLPATGPYLIAVGPTRGNATYELNVSLR
jgi:hypothetical protein